MELFNRGLLYKKTIRDLLVEEKIRITAKVVNEFDEDVNMGNYVLLGEVNGKSKLFSRGCR